MGDRQPPGFEAQALTIDPTPVDNRKDEVIMNIIRIEPGSEAYERIGHAYAEGQPFSLAVWSREGVKVKIGEYMWSLPLKTSRIPAVPKPTALDQYSDMHAAALRRNDMPVVHALEDAWDRAITMVEQDQPEAADDDIAAMALDLLSQDWWQGGSPPSRHSEALHAGDVADFHEESTS